MEQVSFSGIGSMMNIHKSLFLFNYVYIGLRITVSQEVSELYERIIIIFSYRTIEIIHSSKLTTPTIRKYP